MSLEMELFIFLEGAFFSGILCGIVTGFLYSKLVKEW